MSVPPADDGRLAGQATSAEAWREIQTLVDEVADLAETETSVERFHDETLRRLVAVTDAESGLVWLRRDEGFAVGSRVDTNGAAGADGTVPPSVLEARRAVRFEPRANGATAGAEAAGPSRTLCPVFAGDDAVAVLEIRQPPHTPPAARRASTQLLEAVAELVGDFHRNRLLGEFRDRERDWEAQRTFCRNLPLGRSRKEVAVAVANEGRAYVECARLSVLERRAGRWRVVAVSGATRVESRSDVVRRMEALANVLLPAEREFVHVDGEPPDEPLAPQVVSALDAYLEASPARLLHLVALPGREAVARPEAALIAERFDLVDARATRERLRRIVPDAGLAMAAARRPSLLARLSAAWIWWSVLGVLAAVIWVLAVVPADFTVPARGTIEPAVHRRVFAPRAGTVRDLAVSYGDAVDAGDELLELVDADLELQWKTLVGEIQTVSLQLAAAELSRLPGGSSRENPAIDAGAQVRELQERQANLLERRDLLEAERRRLVVKSPVGGRVVSWDLERRLHERPVQRGDLLVEVSRFDGPWRLRLDVPDDEFGHVRAARADGSALRVEYALATEPERTREATIDDVALVTELDERGEAVVRAEVSLAPDEVPVARPGATVVARIHCGRRPLGYVWFHEAIHAVRTWWYR